MTSINASNLLALRSQILQQNSALQKAAGNPAQAIDAIKPATPGTQSAQGSDFGAALKGALEQVNKLQTNAEDMSNSYERGDTTDIASVMLAREKASVGFQATLQVRNKLLSAYKDIMSMAV